MTWVYVGLVVLTWSTLVLAGLGYIRLLEVAKDGGPTSTVTGFWIIEIKGLFSIALLKFNPGSREEFHSHAFNSVSWVLSGRLKEEHLLGHIEYHPRSWRPVLTLRSTFHRVFSLGTSWVLTFRGPWDDEWQEYSEAKDQFVGLTHGRKVVWST